MRVQGSLLVLAICLSPSLSRAQAVQAAEPTKESAEVLFEQAAEFSQKRNYPEAVRLLERAAQLDPTPPILYNLGRLREEIGDVEGAVKAYRDLLERATSGRLADDARARAAQLEARLRLAGSAPGKQGPSQPLPLCPTPAKVELRAAPQTEARPLHKRAWFWVVTVGSALALSGAAVGLTLWLHQPEAKVPSSDLGNMKF